MGSLVHSMYSVCSTCTLADSGCEDVAPVRTTVTVAPRESSRLGTSVAQSDSTSKRTVWLQSMRRNEPTTQVETASTTSVPVLTLAATSVATASTTSAVTPV